MLINIIFCAVIVLNMDCNFSNVSVSFNGFLFANHLTAGKQHINIVLKFLYLASSIFLLLYKKSNLYFVNRFEPTKPVYPNNAVPCMSVIILYFVFCIL